MKPERLVVQAFGPFTGRESIDFARFGEQPMILINGPTGAGKSTILDAICFALYGQTSGGDRDAAHMRSQQAEASLLSEVDFTFSLGGDRWRVHRIPAQLRPKQKGDGQTRQNPQATLWRLEGEVETVEVPRGVEDVTQFVKELTGLNADQFRQVMVLPQGRFRELLVAPSKKREEIFSTLFDSGVYKQLEEALKARASVLRRQVDALNNENLGVLKTAGMSSRDELDQAIEHFSPIVTSMAAKRQSDLQKRDQARESVQLGERLSADFSRALVAQQEVERLEKVSLSLTADRTRLAHAQSALQLEQDYKLLISSRERLKTSVSDIDIHKQTLAQAMVKMTSAVQKAESANKRKENIPDLQTSLKQLQKVQEVQAELVPRRQHRIASAKQVETSAAAQKAATRAVDESRQHVLLMEQKVEQDRVKVSQLGEVQVNAERLSYAVKKLAELNATKTRLVSLETQLRQENEKRSTLIEQVEHDVKALTELEYRWHAGQAMVLAQKLDAGVACPVCGSKEHPSPCSETPFEELVEQNQIDSARKALDSQKLALQKIDSLCQKLEGDRNRLGTDVDSMSAELVGYASETESQLKKRLADQLALRRDLEALRDTLPSLESSLKAAREKTISLETVFVEKRDAALEAVVTQKQSDTEYAKVLQQIPEQHRVEAQVNNSVDTLSGQIKQIEDLVENAEKALREAQMEHARHSTRADSLNEAMTSSTEHLRDAELTWERNLAKSEFTDEVDFNRSVLSSAALNTLSRQLQSHDQALHKARGVLTEAKVAVENRTQPDLSGLNLAATQAEEQLKRSQDAEKNEQEQLSALLSAKAALVGNDQAEQQLHAQFAVTGRLADVASGQSASKVSLQRYVLSVLLDDVLVDASRRLREMSGQRYELVRRQETAGGRGASGLELDVLDAWSGRSRPVSTLSGGESFQAALAMALGLSEVVQAYAGGIRLDTLFIDEGFGSLDGDALERAIEMLVDLQATGRMVGVISHVTEMKEQIAQRLDVVPSLSGSRIQIHI